MSAYEKSARAVYRLGLLWTFGAAAGVVSLLARGDVSSRSVCEFVGLSVFLVSLVAHAGTRTKLSRAVTTLEAIERGASFTQQLAANALDDIGEGGDR